MRSILLKRIIAILGLAICLALINWKILEKQEHLANGKIVLLTLAPVDPRSLMQGDFMALRYVINEDIARAVKLETSGQSQKPFNADGYAWVTLDENNVARLEQARLNTSPDTHLNAPGPSAIALHFRIRKHNVQLGTNAFFFQEGFRRAFEAAQFGAFRVSDKGELLLTHLVDSEYQIINPSSHDKATVQN